MEPFIISLGENQDAKKVIKINDGFTLVELLATLVILGLILAISIPSIGSVILTAEERACHSNQQLIEDGYERMILTDNSDLTFSAYMDGNQLNQCPADGIYTYVDEKVTCSKHPRFDNDKPEPEEVPWL